MEIQSEKEDDRSQQRQRRQDCCRSDWLLYCWAISYEVSFQLSVVYREEQQSFSVYM